MLQIFWLEGGKPAQKSEKEEKGDVALSHRAKGGVRFKKRGRQQREGVMLRTKFSKPGGHRDGTVSGVPETGTRSSWFMERVGSEETGWL